MCNAVRREGQLERWLASSGKTSISLACDHGASECVASWLASGSGVEVVSTGMVGADAVRSACSACGLGAQAGAFTWRSVSAISISLAKLSQREIRERSRDSSANAWRASGRSRGCARRLAQSRYSSSANRHMIQAFPSR